MDDKILGYEYACQKRYPLRWQIVGLGPTDLETARQDFRDWSADETFSEFRIVRRPILDWQVTDQSFTTEHRVSRETSQS